MSNKILQGFPCPGQLANAALQSQPCSEALEKEWAQCLVPGGTSQGLQIHPPPPGSRQLPLRDQPEEQVVHLPWAQVPGSQSLHSVAPAHGRHFSVTA